MRKTIEKWIMGEDLEDVKLLTLIDIDWLDSKQIKYAGEVIVDRDRVVSDKYKHLSFENEELDSADALLIKIIKGLYKFDTSTGVRGIETVKRRQLNDVFRPFPKKYYDKMDIGTSTPWVPRRLMMDIYIYSKLANNKIWNDWTHSKLGKDKYLLHKPEAMEPFSVVFQDDWIWKDK